MSTENEGVSWRLMVEAALEGARQAGYSLERQPRRGLSSIYELTKNGETKIASVKTTRNRWIAFVPLERGTRWKTLEDVEVILLAAVDNRNDPRYVDVYIFPADEVRRRFDISHAARLENGYSIRDDYAMWVKLDPGDPTVAIQVGSGLSKDYPPIARLAIAELEKRAPSDTEEAMGEELMVPIDEAATAVPALATVAEILIYAREKIAFVTGMPMNSINLDLRVTL